MADFALVENSVPRLLLASEYVLVPAGSGLPERKVPVSSLARWTEAERNAISTYTVGQDTTPVPSSMKVVGRELQYDQPSNTVKWFPVLAPYPLGERKQAMRLEVDVRMVQQIEVGYSHDFGPALGNIHELDTRREVATGWIDYRNACKEKIDAGQGTEVMILPIRDKNDVDILVRANQGMNCMVGMRDREGTIVKHARTIRDQIRAATDHAALDAIDINAGWPA